MNEYNVFKRLLSSFLLLSAGGLESIPARPPAKKNETLRRNDDRQ
jgi:hypothetical protein